jgi:hypothetical protein
MTLDTSADVRRIDPLYVPRVKNPMNEDLQFTLPARPSASASPQKEEP